jgi:hypothetical protein
MSRHRRCSRRRTAPVRASWLPRANRRTPSTDASHRSPRGTSRCLHPFHRAENHSASPSSHILVDLGDDRIDGHRRVIAEPLGAQQSGLLAGVADEEDRALGRVALRDIASAISRMATVPEPSSSAPLRMESRRGRLTFLKESRCAIFAHSSAVGVRCGESAPIGRMTRLNARSESWSTGK